MPKSPGDQIIRVRNLTAHQIELRSLDGDSVNLLPRHNGAGWVPILAKFVMWVKPPADKVRILDPIPTEETTVSPPVSIQHVDQE